MKIKEVENVMENEYLKIIDEKAEILNAISDAVWDHAETAFLENQSAKVLMDFLQQEGFEITCPAYGLDTAFTASFGSGKPSIGILGEFDALSGLSQESDRFEKVAIEEGANGHGCGHNLLGVGSLAAALAAKKYLEDSKAPGTIIYYGCPGEEGGSGKAFMAREGAFVDLDCALSWHPAETNNVVQYTSLANIQVLYKFKGTSAHAAGNPEDGRSALDALELMNIGVNFLREHMISSARVHYAIVNAGGYSPNVVQPKAEGIYLIRAPKMHQAQDLFKRVDKIAQGMAMATETTVEYDLIKTCTNIIPNRVLEKELFKSMKEVPVPVFTDEDYAYAKKMTETSDLPVGKALEKLKVNLRDEENRQFLEERYSAPLYDFVIPYEETVEPSQLNGSTDVGDVSWLCPTAQIQTATWAPNSGGHSWQIVSQGKGNIAHQATLYCGKVLGLTAINLMKSPQVLAEARAEFDKALKGQTYPFIPKEVKPRPLNKL